MQRNFDLLIKSEIAKPGRLVRAAGIKAD